MTVRFEGRTKTVTSPNPSVKSGPAECRRKALDWKEGYTDKSTWLFSRCWDDYLADVKARTSDANYKNVEKLGRLYLAPRLGTFKMYRISDQDWQDCITKIDKPLSRKYLSDIRGTVAGFWRYAKRSRMIERIPDPLRLPTNAPVIGKGILMPEQVETLFSASEAWYINAWRLMAATGMRPGEVYGLQKSDISEVIRVRRSVNTDNKITQGKNKNAIREVALSTAAEIIIMDQLERIRKMETELHKVTPWLFPEPDASDPSHRRAYQEWTRYRAANGIHVSPYSLRHTFVSMNKDVPLATLKRMLGHTEDMDTHRVYDHKVDGDYKKAADSIDNSIGRYIK